MNARMDDFNSGCVHILGALYTAFPVPIDLRMDSFATDAATQAIYGHTLTFLADEGLLSFVQKLDALSFSGVRLTAKGLTKMNKTAP
jgi:hypothetical protein